VIALALLLLFGGGPADPIGPWRAVVDLAGGPLRFAIEIRSEAGGLTGEVCNATSCTAITGVTVLGDSLDLEIGDYAATISAALRRDSLIGTYHNVGNRGPRVIPFRAARGRWPVEPVPPMLPGRWDAAFERPDGTTSPRVLEFRATDHGLEGTILSNTGDYGLFWGRADRDSFSLGHFDGSFVYMLTGRLEGDTLRGVFHAGRTTQTRWTAVRSSGASPLRDPTTLTSTDTSTAFTFAFPDLEGHLVRNDDPRFRGKVLLVDIFGTWCPTCHDAAPALVRLYREYHDRGLEIVGLAYEVTGDTAIDRVQVRHFRDKFGIRYPLLLAGINVTEETAATLPQLEGFTAYPTTLFLDRSGKVRRIQAGFFGPAAGARHARLLADFRREIERLLAEP